MNTNNIKEVLLMMLAGALSVFAFAPFYFFPAMWVSLSLFLISIFQLHNIRQATWRSFLYGFGFYLANIHWIYISLHTYGGMQTPLAVLLVCILGGYLALYPALATYLSFRFFPSQPIRILIALPAFWTLGEWVRSWLFTGFPWGNIGYSHIPATPLAGFVPILGIYSVSFFIIFSVALAVWGLYFYKKYFTLTLLSLGCLWGTGFGLRFIEWTQPQGKPLSVSLVQGNIPQSLKWQPHILPQTLHTYLELVKRSPGELIILPETAIPVFLQNLSPSYIAHFRISTKGHALIAGIPTLDEMVDRYYNSAVLVTDPALPVYNKHHLVPFGEYIPLRPLLGWIFNSLNIPLTDFGRGAARQSPFSVQDQYIAFNICYEDIFGEEIIQALPTATILANISNLAWFDGSVALAQHGQIAQARALETGRPMLRATNTGLTAMIDHHGQFIARAPIREEAILTAFIQGRQGRTPYGKIGNAGILGLLAVLILLGLTRYKLQSATDKSVM
jgi:apolipoprotein N-acyltransferase